MAKDTIYLCNFRVSVDGEWLCLKELADVQFEPSQTNPAPPNPDIGINKSIYFMGICSDKALKFCYIIYRLS